jgi:hypothetical protein
MEQVRFFFLLVFFASLLFLGVGLYKPWIMLWWEDTQNRKKVLYVYGTVGLVALAVYLLLALVLNGCAPPPAAVYVRVW